MKQGKVVNRLDQIESACNEIGFPVFVSPRFPHEDGSEHESLSDIGAVQEAFAVAHGVSPTGDVYIVKAA